MTKENRQRKMLNDLILSREETYLSISILLGRNAAYMQQFIKRGIPRKLDEDDRHILAAHFGIDQRLLSHKINTTKLT